MPRSPAIQIYCREPTMGEVSALVELGVEFVGWDLEPKDGERLLLSSRLIEMIREAGRTSTVLVHSRNQDHLERVANFLRPDYLLLSSDREGVSLATLKRSLPAETSLMIPVPVRASGSEAEIPSLSIAERVAQHAGMLTVDTCPDPGDLSRFGCTGKVNDWEVCAEIVSEVDVGVVLAGGLNSSNVSAAIEKVHPAAVDACTSLEFPDRSKDLALCRKFVDAVRRSGSRSDR